MRWRPDPFLLGMGLAVLLAWWAPAPGAPGGWLRPEITTKLGIALVFFLHGLTLPFESLRAGTLNWRLHLVVQAGTFLLFPLLWLALEPLLRTALGPELTLGFFYLCVLPSTVSSSVAMTAAGGGNVAAAVFNATLSGLLGIVLTPLWMAWRLQTTGVDLPLGPVILEICLLLLLPFVVGQLLHPRHGARALRHKAWINRVDRGTILLLVYTSFCGSFQAGVWADRSWAQIAGVMVLNCMLFAGVMLLLAGVCRLWGFSHADRTAVLFCGSKKTLASGVPMAKLIFGAHPALGLYLLPILLYHQLQLVLCAWLAVRFRAAESLK